jgi:hypothetical protein
MSPSIFVSSTFTDLKAHRKLVREAIEPSLIYLIDEDSHPVLPKDVDTGPPAEKLVALKNTLKKSHVVNFFSSPEDLASKVTQDLVQLVGAMNKQPTAHILSQLAANAIQRHPLTPPRFEYLKTRTSGAFKHEVPDSILREALELVIGGDNMAAAMVLSRGTPMPLDDAVDGLMEFEKALIDIMTRYQHSEKGTSDV